ncbi:MAG: lysylphosphatidylglycerol synthase transmembrane domain-containing protein [Pseudomonadota bacterium]
METLGPQHSRRLAFFIVGAFVVAAIVLVVLNVGDITDFMEQSARADPRWLAAAVASQLMTYACVVLVWRRVLKSMGFSLGFLRLYPLAIAKMFSDQAVPSGGVAGAAFLFRALGRRGVPYANAFTVFSFTAVTFFAAFLLAASISLAAIATVDDASPALSTSIAAFAAAVSILVLAVSAIALLGAKPPPALKRIPYYDDFSEWIRRSATFFATERRLFLEATMIHFVVRAFDGMTLYLVILAIGGASSPAICFFAAVFASIAATVAPIPMGLGTFEAGMIATLSLFGSSVEEALAATLIFRGLSLWLPMLPGLLIVQREILGASETVNHSPADIA